MSTELLLTELSLDSATLARSVLGRIRALGNVSEREGKGEIAFTVGAVELCRLVLRAGSLPRLVFAPEPGQPWQPPRDPIEITGLPAAAAAADAVRLAAEAEAARAPQLDLFGNKR